MPKKKKDEVVLLRVDGIVRACMSLAIAFVQQDTDKARRVFETMADHHRDTGIAFFDWVVTVIDGDTDAI